LAIPWALRSSFSGRRRSVQHDPTTPLFEFRLRLGHRPAKPSRPRRGRAGSSQGLWFPTAHKAVEGPLHAGQSLPATFRPQGLGTLSTVFSLRRPAGSVSCRRRSWDSPFGAFSSRKVPGRFRTGGPTYRFAQRYSPPSEDVGPARWAAVPGLRPSRESLAAERVFSMPTAGCSLGLRPCRVCRPRPGPGFRRNSSCALRKFDPGAEPACASESRSALAWPRRPPAQAPPRTGQPS